MIFNYELMKLTFEKVDFPLVKVSINLNQF